MRKSSVQEYVNVTVFKRFALAIVILLLIIQGIRYIDSGGNACGRLLNGGTLIDSDVWHPTGCMIHKYRNPDGFACLGNQKVAFVGDSRVRQLYYSFMKKFFNIVLEGKRHEDIHANNIDVSFYWRPELNGSLWDLYRNWTQDVELQPSLIVHAAASHTIKRLNGSDDCVERFEANFTKTLPLMQALVESKQSKIYWMLQAPVSESKLSAPRKCITNSLLMRFNDAAIQQLEGEEVGIHPSIHPNISVVYSPAQLAAYTIQQSLDGLHLPAQADDLTSQILMNLFCNDVKKPIDGSCCQHPPSFTVLQLIALVIGAFSVAASLLMKVCGGMGDAREVLEEQCGGGGGKKLSAWQKLEELTSACARMSFILLYFYICDRTDIFMKSNKHFTISRFLSPLLYISMIGLFGVSHTKQPGFLNRDQTDEWKGWMQLLILIYHVSGASVNVPIYMHIRLLVSMYLFMTGYGHFAFFWNKGDFGLRRVFGVLFRLNFLTLLLCVVMNRSYQFYYFVPLCSFWFSLLYVVMAIFPRAHIATTKPVSSGVEKNSEDCRVLAKSPALIMVFKLLALLILIILLFFSEESFARMFSWWPAVRLFELPRGSVEEWWFRSRLDRFAMFYGALCSFGYHMLKRFALVDDLKQGFLFSAKASIIAFFTSIFVICSYTYWAVSCADKVACNEIHSYASLLPITSFILIRNIPGYLRAGYSSFFAWFGKISLELFIAQYHIWLAADTKGVLVLVTSDWPMLNLVITTFVFVCVAHEINRLTSVFARHVVGSPHEGNRALALRVAVFATAVVCLVLVNDLTNSRSES